MSNPIFNSDHNWLDSWDQGSKRYVELRYKQISKPGKTGREN